jgi:hypothetical protein
MPALGVFEVSRFYFNRDEKSTAIASAPTQFRKDKRSLACCDLSQLSNLHVAQPKSGDRSPHSKERPLSFSFPLPTQEEI